jgi:hypothetical protein
LAHAGAPLLIRARIQALAKVERIRLTARWLAIVRFSMKEAVTNEGYNLKLT